MFERKKINLTDFFNAKGQDEEMNDYFIALLEIINEPRFYLKDIGVNSNKIFVVALASNNPKDKADWIENKIN